MTAQIIGIIPARYGSTRFPGKPLFYISGKTLLQRTYENAKRSSVLDDLIVATDDQRIFDHVQSFGGKVVMTSENCPTGTDRLAEVLEKYPNWTQAAAIVNIQGDEPCLDPATVNEVARILISDPQADMSTAATPLLSEEDAQSSSIVKCVMDQFQNALYFSRALIPSNKKQNFNSKVSYFRHLGIYAYRPHFLLKYQKLSATPLQIAEDLEQLKVLEHGYRIKVAIVDHVSIGVDTPEDVNKVEQWLCKQNSFLSQAASVHP
jgi:3-deoxy-manno-octulosonate cytidylyltransferase (CMP-KDO synthetase)